MLERSIPVLLVAAAVGSGLVAGIFFAFSTFVMAALGRLPPEQGVAAMQSINVTVLNPAFLTAFLGTGILALALAAGSVWWGPGSGLLVVTAGLLYLVGCVGVTMACNVPLNDALAAVRPGTPEAASLWARYLADWTLWNHVRTVAPLLSAVLYILAVM